MKDFLFWQKFKIENEKKKNLIKLAENGEWW